MKMNVLGFLLFFISFMIGNVCTNDDLDDIFEDFYVCEENWHRFGNYCYKADGYDDRLTWRKASARCKRMGGFLASIHSEEENAFLTVLLEIHTETFTWIGLNDREEESVFQWADGSSFDYMNWIQSEPSGSIYGNEDCVGMFYDYRNNGNNYRHGRWNDGSCKDKHPYICKRSGVLFTWETSESSEMEKSSEVSSAVKESNLNEPPVSSEVLIFENLSSLLNASQNISPGSLAFLTDKEDLLVKIKDRWQYVKLGAMAAFTKQLRLIALNKPQIGDMFGSFGADKKCNEQAAAANLRGNFRAFLASSSRNLKDVVIAKDAELPIVNLKGDKLFDSWKTLLEDTGSKFPYSSTIYSFDGKDVLNDVRWYSKKIWLGSNLLGEADVNANCDSWTAADWKQVGLASSLINRSLLDPEKSPCNSYFIVLCIETTRQDDFSKEERNENVRFNGLFPNVDVELTI